MAINIDDIDKSIDAFEKKQLENFNRFIDTSIKLKSKSQGIKDKSEKNYQQMKSQVNRFINSDNHVESGLPIDILNDDKAYITLLQNVEIPKYTGESQTIIEYMKNQISKTDEYMKQKAKSP